MVVVVVMMVVVGADWWCGSGGHCLLRDCFHYGGGGRAQHQRQCGVCASTTCVWGVVYLEQMIYIRVGVG